MTSTRTFWLGCLCALPLAACASSDSARSASPASVTGELDSASYALSAATVVAQDTNGTFFAAELSSDGHFTLSLPVDAQYRFSIADTTASGTFVTVSRIRLPVNDALWVRFEGGATLDLGRVHLSDEGNDASVHEQGGKTHENAAVSQVPACVPSARAGDADLPYDVKLEVGDTFRLSDAFLEKGPKPAALLSVTMEGEAWHLPALQTDTPFTITAADCGHAGNRDTGRDRIFVTWRNADGSLATDHLDLRYCDGAQSSGSGSSGSNAGGSGGSGSGGSGSDGSDSKGGGASGSGSGGGHGADDDASTHDHGHDDAEVGDDGAEEHGADDCAPGTVVAPVCSAPQLSESKCDGGEHAHVTAVDAPSKETEPTCTTPAAGAPTTPVSTPSVPTTPPTAPAVPDSSVL